MRRYVTEKQDWEIVDDEDYWGMNYKGPTTEMKEKIKSLLHTWWGKPSRTTGREATTETGEKKILSTPRVQRPRNIGRQESGKRGHLRHHQESPRNGSSPNFRKTRILGHDQRPYQSRYNTKNSHDPASLRPLKPRRGTMATPQAHPRRLRYQPSGSQHTTRTKTTTQIGQRKKTQIICLEGTTCNERSIPSHQISRGHGPDHPTLLQKCGERKRKNLGRKDLNPTTNGDKLVGLK